MNLRLIAPGCSTPDLSFRFNYFAMRKMHLAMRASTMDERFELLTLRQTVKAPSIPIVLTEPAALRPLARCAARAETHRLDAVGGNAGIAEHPLERPVAWKFGKNTAQLEYLSADIWRANPQIDPLDNRYELLVSVGLDHALGEDTKLFAFLTAGDTGGTSESNRYLAIGIQHNF